METYHYYAAVCRRGHVIDPMIEPARGQSEPIPDRCGECGAKVLIACPTCQTRIQGLIRGVVVTGWKPKDFCHQCGQPYPWASCEAIAYHIENLLDEDPSLSEGDKRALREQLAALRESPADPASDRRQVAAMRFLQRTAPKVWDLAMPVLQVILTAEAKRQLGLPPV